MFGSRYLKSRESRKVANPEVQILLKNQLMNFTFVIIASATYSDIYVRSTLHIPTSHSRGCCILAAYLVANTLARGNTDDVTSFYEWRVFCYKNYEHNVSLAKDIERLIN